MFVSEPVLRASLWVACPFNLLAAYLVALPGSLLGQFYGLPPEVPPLYAGLAAMFIALFGFAYLRRHPHRWVPGYAWCAGSGACPGAVPAGRVCG